MKHWQKCKQAECSLCMPVKSENRDKNDSNKLLGQLHSSNNPKGKLHNKQLNGIQNFENLKYFHFNIPLLQ